MADVARFPDGIAASRVELNWIGFQALYGREMRRVLVVWVPLGVLTLWFIYRIARGWMALNDNRPVPA